jgi:hypothetical protein
VKQIFVSRQCCAIRSPLIPVVNKPRRPRRKRLGRNDSVVGAKKPPIYVSLKSTKVIEPVASPQLQVSTLATQFFCQPLDIGQ